MNWFDYRGQYNYPRLVIPIHGFNAEYSAFKWLERHALPRLPFGRRSQEMAPPAQGIWKDREEAETAMKAYLEDYPCTQFRPFAWRRP